VRDKPGRRRFTVRSGDGENRYAIRFARRKQHIDDVFGDVSADAFARREVHPKTGRGVDFDNSAAVFPERLGDIRRDDVNADDIQADDFGDALEQKNVFGMRLIRAVNRRSAGRDVRRRFQNQSFVLRQNGLERIIFRLQKFFG